ncbi:MAG: DinB family protein [Muricauda sp.]|nr:DinB family protein [Allomuricauda sp.]
MNPIIQHTIQQLTEIRTGKPWMGSSFAHKLANLDETLVFERPQEHLHSVAEIISHLTFWRREALLKIKTGQGSRMDDDPENWLPNDVLQQKGWDQIQKEYDATLNELIALLQDKEDSFLSKIYYDTDFKGEYPYSFLINGILHHDVYHLGQLGIIIKFLKEK